jgi:aminopeptidase N
VLDYNRNKALTHFRQVKDMLSCFEHYLGKYPFWNDGYKLVEAPYWGMEHQSAIAYGNNYKNNAFGFDFIIIHESGHEYFGNSLSCQDHGELWIHESFTTYMESLYVEYFSSFERAVEYLESQKTHIVNNKPIMGPLGVNYNDWQDADMYYKGAWMLHSIRNMIDNDSIWFRILFDLYQHFKFRNVSSKDIIGFIDDQTDLDLAPIFTQYLYTTKIPQLRYSTHTKKNRLVLKFQWVNVVKGFNMPVVIKPDEGVDIKLYPVLKKKKAIIPGASEIHFRTELFYFYPLEK